jgi:uncharacterized protein YuzE
MKSRYDKSVDVLLIKLKNKKPAYGEDIWDGIIVHYDKERNPVEIEILGAKRHLIDWMGQALEVRKEAVTA